VTYNRGVHVAVLLGLVVADVALQVAAWALLPFEFAITAIVTVTGLFIWSLARWTQAKYRHGWV
jgi:hypothetical protein